MSTAPRYDIDPQAFWQDPYPDLARLRAGSPIAFVPQLGATLFTRRDDIFVFEKQVQTFSSDQPQGLMTKLMGLNLMRKDGEAHVRERSIIAPALSPRAVKDAWRAQFERLAAGILARLAPLGTADLRDTYARELSAEALKVVTGLTNMRFEDMDAWSQAMIDGISNYAGVPEVEARCHAATAGIDAAIDARLPELMVRPDQSLLGVMLAAGLPMDSIRANIKLAISGGQNEPRDAIAGCVWALLTHPEQCAAAREGAVRWIDVFEEYVRWIAPIGMSPRRVAQPWSHDGITLAPDDRVFFMFGSANRDERHFERPEAFDVRRDTSKAVPFGAGPHYCAGAFVSRCLVAEVALPMLFAALPDLRLAPQPPVQVGGWAFRGLLNLPVRWRA